MSVWKKVGLTLSLLFLIAVVVGYWLFTTRESREPSFVAWNNHCAACHGAQMQGTDKGPSLMLKSLKQGDSVEALMQSITQDFHKTAISDWEQELSPELIKGLSLYISERRQAFPTTAASYQKVPTGNKLISSTHHDFVLQHITDLQSRPYSMAYMPDGNLLVSEKIRGLSMVDAKGHQSDVISDTPEVWDTVLSVQGSWLNWGIVLDVELAPDYETSGWIYLSHTDRCQLSCGWPVPATMVRVIRGRIKDGAWVDQEVIWSVHKDHYTPVPDAVAAGRLAFDGRGHVFISIGGKNTYSKLHDMNTPYGKIHRVREDGSVPSDNPFWTPPETRSESSTAHTVWSFGHRTGQGLDAHPLNGDIWNTEMGPRGGDEINRIEGGQNYGWPLYTNGLDYNGEEVSIGKDLGLDFPIESTVLPVVDFTPAPAVSNFTFHAGDQFPKWQNDLLVGSLKATTLYRLRVEDNELVELEKLITDFGRIRDVVMGGDGYVYIAIEHGESGSLWRLVPQ